jgi:hypothetical protein
VKSEKIVGGVMFNLIEGSALRSSTNAASGIAFPERQAGCGVQADCFSPFTFHLSLFTYLKCC